MLSGNLKKDATIQGRPVTAHMYSSTYDLCTVSDVSYLYTPGSICGMLKLFSRSRRTSFSILTWEGSRSLGSLAGLIDSDWKKAARSLREEAEDSRAVGIRLFSGHAQGSKTGITCDKWKSD